MLALPLSWSAPTDPTDLALNRANMACFRNADTPSADRANHETKLTGASTNQQKVVEAVLDRISRVGGEAFIKKLNIEFKSSTATNATCAGSTKEKAITLTACTEDGHDELAKQLVSQIAKVAGPGFYNSYKSKMPTCGISTAAKSSRQEEFREVFISYLTSPDALQKLCPAQYGWLHQNVFHNSGADPSEGCPANPAPPAPERRAARPAQVVAPPAEPPATDKQKPTQSNSGILKQAADFTPVALKIYDLFNKKPAAATPTEYPPFTPFPTTQYAIPTTRPALPVQNAPAPVTPYAPGTTF